MYIYPRFKGFKNQVVMEKFSLKWNDFQANISKTFSTLRQDQDFQDITLLSDDGEAVSVH